MRRDPVRHRALMRRASMARHAAVSQLIARHEDEFRWLYLREAELRGVNVRPVKRPGGRKRLRDDEEMAFLDATTSRG